MSNVSQLYGLYKTHLGREPDIDGFNFWKNTGMSGAELESAFLEGAKASGSKIISGGSGSGGGVSSNNSATNWNAPNVSSQLTSLYEDTLGRDPDQSGYNFWMGTGLSGDALDTAFRGSENYANEYNNAFSSFADTASGLSNKIQNFDFGMVPAGSGKDFFSGLSDAFQSSLDSVSGFRAPTGDFSFVDGSSVLDNFSGLGDQISELGSTYNSEFGRVSGFEENLSSQTQSIMDEISGLSIADVDAMRSLGDRLDALGREASRFNSFIPFDLSDEIGGFDDATAALNNLFQQRASEQERINDAMSGFTGRGRSLQSRLSSGGFQDLGEINNVSELLEGLRGDISGFETPLDFDTSPFETGMLADLESMLSTVTSNRTRNLDDLSLQYEDLLADLDRARPYEENLLRSLSRDASGLVRSASPYTGGERSINLNADISSLRDRSSEMLDAFYERQESLPDEAAQRLEDLRAMSFYDLDQIEDARSDLDPFMDIMSNYGLSDDRSLSRLGSYLSEQEARIKQDQANAEARKAAAQAGLGSMADVGSMSLWGDSTSDAQYQQLLAMLQSMGGRRVDDGYSGYVPFSASKMVRI